MTTFVFVSGLINEMRLAEVGRLRDLGCALRELSKEDAEIVGRVRTGGYLAGVDHGTFYALRSEDRELGDEIVCNVREETEVQGLGHRDTGLWSVLMGYGKYAKCVLVVTRLNGLDNFVDLTEYARHVVACAADNRPVDAVYIAR
jgi:hypothetical protein